MRSWLMIGALAVSLTACQQSPDVEEIATGALKGASLDDDVSVSYDESARVVRLSGTVDNAGEREKAYDVVHTSVGELAQVANEIVVEGIDAKIADDLDGGIEERFHTLWQNAPESRDADVDIRVENGVVTLTGDTPGDASRAKAEEVARSIPGVTQIVNSLTVKGEPVKTEAR